MASSPNLDDDDDFGGDYAGNIPRNKRPRTLDDDEDFKEHTEEEHAPGAATGIVLILRDSLKKSEEDCKLYQARRLLLDPAIHEEFTRLKSAAEEKEKKIKELEENLAAVNFTPQSKMGKMLMAKCRTLQEENEEIGMMASEGKIHELGMKLKLQKNQNLELRRQIQELLDYMEMLEEGVDKSNELLLTSLILYLVNTVKKQFEGKDYETKTLTEGKKQKSGGKEDKKSSDSGNAVDGAKTNR